MTTVKERIWSIVRLRYDELDVEHRLDLMEKVSMILLAAPNWTEAESMIKREWGRVQSDQVNKRRGTE